MEIRSSVFGNNSDIPSKYTCDGDGINPPLDFVEIPSGAMSLVLIMFDPDIPLEFKDKMNIPGWDHWAVWNIKPQTSGIAENGIPDECVQGNNTGGVLGYVGPCPPKEKEPPKHRYVFTLFAIDMEKLDLPEGSTRQQVLDAIEGHVIEKAELVGWYEKGD